MAARNRLSRRAPAVGTEDRDSACARKRNTHRRVPRGRRGSVARTSLRRPPSARPRPEVGALPPPGSGRSREDIRRNRGGFAESKRRYLPAALSRGVPARRRLGRRVFGRALVRFTGTGFVGAPTVLLLRRPQGSRVGRRLCRRSRLRWRASRRALAVPRRGNGPGARSPDPVGSRRARRHAPPRARPGEASAGPVPGVPAARRAEPSWMGDSRHRRPGPTTPAKLSPRSRGTRLVAAHACRGG